MTTITIREEEVHLPDAMQRGIGLSGVGILHRTASGRTESEARANLDKAQWEGDDKGLTPVLLQRTIWIKRGPFGQKVWEVD